MVLIAIAQGSIQLQGNISKQLIIYNNHTTRHVKETCMITPEENINIQTALDYNKTYNKPL